MTTLLIIAVTLVLPLTPLGRVFGFEPLPFWFILVIVAVVLSYVAGAEITKRIFYSKVKF
jgi:Mg2+-importing ATPase